MAEVYTISGAGAMDTIMSVVSPGYASNVAFTEALATRAVRSAAPSSAPSKASPVARLQNALRSLGVTKGDPTLSKLKVDGVVGPGTTKAVNYAIAQHYVVMPSFPNPNLTVQHVRQFAVGIATAVEGAVASGGGTLAPVKMAAPRPRGGGIPAALPPDVLAPAESSHKWVWWAVGGLGVLVILSIAAKAVRGKPKRRAKDDDED